MFHGIVPWYMTRMLLSHMNGSNPIHLQTMTRVEKVTYFVPPEWSTVEDVVWPLKFPLNLVYVYTGILTSQILVLDSWMRASATKPGESSHRPEVLHQQWPAKSLFGVDVNVVLLLRRSKCQV
jgi:hypothetical protein